MFCSIPISCTSNELLRSHADPDTLAGDGSCYGDVNALPLFEDSGSPARRLSPSGPAGLGAGGGTQHRLLHRGNQGALLQKAK